MVVAQDTCWQQTKSEALVGLRGIPGALGSIPAGFAHSDYRWVLPAGLATGLLAGTGADQKASRQITSKSAQHTSSVLSNVGLIAVEVGGAGGAFLIGCQKGPPHLRSAGFHAIEAMGYATAENEVLKLAFNRERPDKPGGDGRFWHSGKSFPSGHAVASWAFASALAHESPHDKWLKVGAYSMAVVVTGLRFTAKKHFPSDLVAGGVIGYATGRHLGE
jgi:hypothetical protein